MPFAMSERRSAGLQLSGQGLMSDHGDIFSGRGQDPVRFADVSEL
jgi:hypothetical protein